MGRTFLALTAPLLLVTLGLAHGRLTNRWATSPELAAAVERLQRVPLTVGEWQGQDEELDARQVRIGELDGYVLRRYENAATGASVSVLLVCGRPGPIAAHSPEVCYRGLGYQMAGAVGPYKVEADGLPGAAEFQTARFVKDEAGGSRSLRIVWSWNGDGKWRAPGNPRFAYAGRPCLYKFYVVRGMASAEEKPEEDPSREFLKQFLVELDRALR
jgi:Protein of unknown function (DUF3485)